MLSIPTVGFWCPEVFTGSELKEMRDFGYRLHHDPESIPEHERSPVGGPLQKLIDHPLVVSLLNEFTAHPAVTSPECYGFAVESTSPVLPRTWYGTIRTAITATDSSAFPVMSTTTTLFPR